MNTYDVSLKYKLKKSSDLLSQQIPASESGLGSDVALQRYLFDLSTYGLGNREDMSPPSGLMAILTSKEVAADFVTRMKVVKKVVTENTYETTEEIIRRTINLCRNINAEIFPIILPACSIDGWRDLFVNKERLLNMNPTIE